MSLPLIISLLAILVVLSVLGVLYIRKSEKKATNNTDKLAKKLGLNFEPGTLKDEPSIHGTYQGIPLMVKSVVASSGTAIMYTTTYTATLTGKHIPIDLVVYREGLLSKVSKAFGSEDIQLNDPELDNTFMIKGAAHHDARVFFLRPHVKTCFLKMAEETDKFRLENNTLSFDFPHRMIEQGDALIETMDRIVAYAKTINNSISTVDYSEHIDPNDLLGESTTLEVPIPNEADLVT